MQVILGIIFISQDRKNENIEKQIHKNGNEIPGSQLRNRDPENKVRNKVGYILLTCFYCKLKFFMMYIKKIIFEILVLVLDSIIKRTRFL